MKLKHLILPSISLILTIIPLCVEYYIRKRKRIKKDVEIYYRTIFPRYEYRKCREHINWRAKHISCEEEHCPRYFLKEIIELFASAKYSVSICCNHITLYELETTLKELHRKGIKIRIITDAAMIHATKSKNKSLDIAGIAIKINKEQKHILHHKFSLVDHEHSNVRKVMFGSMNLTIHALCYNYECAIITNEPRIVQGFSQIFHKLWNSESFVFL